MLVAILGNAILNIFFKSKGTKAIKIAKTLCKIGIIYSFLLVDKVKSFMQKLNDIINITTTPTNSIKFMTLKASNFLGFIFLSKKLFLLFITTLLHNASNKANFL